MWGRVVVGVDGSLTSLAALRQAVAIARPNGVPLRAVWVCQQVVGHVTVESSVPRNPQVVAAGQQRVDEAFARALGGCPPEVPVTVDVRAYEGNVGAALVAIASRETDLLVVGTGTARRWFRPRARAVSRYCLLHARCPVLVVPLSEFARDVSRYPGTVRRLIRAVARSPYE